MASYKATNINGADTTIISTVACKLHSIVINTTSGGAISVYDSASSATNPIAIFPTSAEVGTYIYDIDTKFGLTIVTAGTGDITVSTGSLGN